MAMKFMKKTISKEDARKDFTQQEVHIDTTDKVVVYSEFRFCESITFQCRLFQHQLRTRFLYCYACG